MSDPARPVHVTWEIDYDGEGSAVVAARWAWSAMRRPYSAACVFTVTLSDGTTQQVDLLDDEDYKPAAVLRDSTGPLMDCEACDGCVGVPDTADGWARARRLADEHNAAGGRHEPLQAH